MRKKNEVKVRWIIYIAAFFSAYFLLAMLLTHGEAFYNIYFRNNILDELRYSDFFTMVIKPYGRGFYLGDNEIYPPVGLLFYPLLAMLMPDRLMDGNWHTLAESPEGMLAYQVTNVIFIVLFVWICARAIQFKDYKKWLLIFALLVSFPMIYNYERGNNLIYTMLFMMLFVFWKDSDKRWQRELSLVFLALAAAMKLTPALLGLTLLTEKRYKDAIKAVVYGVIAYALPFFLFFDGTASIVANVRATFGFSAFLSDIIAYSAFLPTWSNFYMAVCAVLGKTVSTYSVAGQGLAELFTLFSLVAVFLTRDNWKRIALLLCVLITFPAVSYSYCLMYLLIPFVLFLNGFSDGAPMKRLDVWYGVLFLLLFVPLPFPSGRFFFFGEQQQVTTYNAIASLFGVIALQTSLIVDSVAGVRKRQLAIAVAALTAISLGVGVRARKTRMEMPDKYYAYAAADDVYQSGVVLLPNAAVVRQEVALRGTHIRYVELLVRYSGQESDGSTLTVRVLDPDSGAVLGEEIAQSWQFTDTGFVRLDFDGLVLREKRAVLEISANIPDENRDNTLLFLAINEAPDDFAGAYALVDGEMTDQIVALRIA